MHFGNSKFISGQNILKMPKFFLQLLFSGVFFQMNMLQQKMKIEDNREKLDFAPVLPAFMSRYLLVTLLHQVLTPSLQLLTIKYSENSFFSHISWCQHKLYHWTGLVWFFENLLKLCQKLAGKCQSVWHCYQHSTYEWSEPDSIVCILDKMAWNENCSCWWKLCSFASLLISYNLQINLHDQHTFSVWDDYFYDPFNLRNEEEILQNKCYSFEMSLSW